MIINKMYILITAFNKDIDKAIKKFLETTEYKDYSEDISALRLALAEKEKCLRCEIFYRVTENYTLQAKIIPFIDTIAAPIKREDIYNANNLKEEGYELNRWPYI